MNTELQTLKQELAHLDQLMARVLNARQKAWESSDPDTAEINEALDIGYKAMEAKREKLIERIASMEEDKK